MDKDYTYYFVDAKCIEVECPHWGLIKIPFSSVDKYFYEYGRDRGLELTFKCPACGEKHEIVD